MVLIFSIMLRGSACYNIQQQAEAAEQLVKKFQSNQNNLGRKAQLNQMDILFGSCF